jgi:ATP-dependent Clp protease ATP-binding subunit ClpB
VVFFLIFLLQVLDDGRLTDNKGRIADFKNTIIIMTSNIGSHNIQENYAEKGKYSDEEVFERTKTEVTDMLKKTLRPEFLNRLDEIVMFQPLSKREIKDIIKLQINDLNSRLNEQGIQVEFTKYALDLLAEMGYDPTYGARPLKRVIQKQILNELSKILLAGTLNKDLPIKVDSFEEGKFAFFN